MLMQIDVHSHAESDIDKIWLKDPDAAADVIATLEQLRVDPNLIDKLTTHGDNMAGPVRLNVKRWERMRNLKGGDLWRFRMLDTYATSYRVVYGYRYQTRQICILAVVHKNEFDYDEPSHPLAKRIAADWSSL